MGDDAFDLLQSAPLRALLAAEGFERPTPAQAAALPEIRAGKHTLLVAPTGMGKTESAILPLFDRLLELKEGLPPKERKGKVRIVYVTPLRALNRDLMHRLHDWGKALGIDVRVRHGDTTQTERNRQSKSPPDVLITTPETLQVMFLGKRLRDALSGMKALVIDEVHELAADERGAQLAIAMERLTQLSGEFQRVGLSATVGDPGEVAAYLGGPRRKVSIVKVPVAKELDLEVVSPEPDARDKRTADKLMCRPEAAAFLNAALDRIVATGATTDRPEAGRVHAQKQTLLFVNTRETAEVLAARLRILREREEDIPPIAVHHGSLAKDVRVQAEESFKRGHARGLICTSSMELGIDIGDADLVIQYSSPRQVTRLVQRVGRAGHKVGLVSNGVIVAQDADDAFESVAIVQRTLDEHVEVFRSPRNPLDVLANQLAAIAIERAKVPARAAYDLVRRAHNFADLPWDDFEQTLAQLSEEYVIWFEGDFFGVKKKSRDYFLENISMIPDMKTYRVMNMVTNRSVATLDEAFVASFAEPGASFILQGQVWRVVEIASDEALIRVEPVRDPLGAVPSWLGEEIPVPFEVAQDVGRLRAEVFGLLAREGEAGAAKRLQAKYATDAGAARKLVEFIRKQDGYALPTHDRLTLEFGGSTCVLNACLGTRVNETLGRLLSSLLTARLGASVGLQTDPYRVILTLPTRVPQDVVRDLIEQLDPDALPSLLELLLTNSIYLRYRLLHVARKFGAVRRDVDYQRVNVARLLDVFKGTPLYREAMREVFDEKLDVPAAQRVLRELRAGERKLVVQAISPVAHAGMDQRLELISPARADRTLLEALQRRLDNEKVLLLCMTCRKWKAEAPVARAQKMRACPECDGKLIAPTRPWNELGRKAWAKRNGKPTDEERKELQRLTTAANLVFDHGYRALIALVARGVGPDTAGRLLHKQKESEEAFLREILAAEINYARTRAFWDA